MEDLETTIMELLVNAGAARSAALTALQMARKGEFDEAEKAMDAMPMEETESSMTSPLTSPVAPEAAEVPQASATPAPAPAPIQAAAFTIKPGQPAQLKSVDGTKLVFTQGGSAYTCEISCPDLADPTLDLALFEMSGSLSDLQLRMAAMLLLGCRP